MEPSRHRNIPEERQSLDIESQMSRLDRAGDAIDRVAATDGALAGIVEHAIFGPELFDGRTPTRGIVFAEHVAKISDH